MCELFEKLNSPFNREDYEYDKNNNRVYVNGQAVAERLNQALGVGYWKYEPHEIEVKSRHVRDNKEIEAVKALVKFSFYNRDLKEWVTFIDAGSQDLNARMWEGDAIKSAITDGMKKCASRIGVASDLYRGLIEFRNGKIVFPDSYYEYWKEASPSSSVVDSNSSVRPADAVDKLITSEQKGLLKEKIGAVSFAKYMNRSGGKMSVSEFEQLMAG